MKKKYSLNETENFLINLSILISVLAGAAGGLLAHGIIMFCGNDIGCLKNLYIGLIIFLPIMIFALKKLFTIMHSVGP